MKHRHGSHGHPPNRGLASKIMRDKSMGPAGFQGGSDVEQADRMGMRSARGAPPPAPSGGGFGMAPGVGGGPMGPPGGGGMPPEEGGGL